MALTPHQIAATRFKTVKRNGYDPDEVDTFQQDARDGARVGAAAGHGDGGAGPRGGRPRLQELSQRRAAPSPAEPADRPRHRAPSRVATVADEAETISRTLLLAQRTADITIAEAERRG